MSAKSIGAAKGPDYARYLEGKTVAPARGDYYLDPSGDPAQAPGRWHMSPATRERLGIDGEDRVVAGRDFVRLMEGRHPGSGEWLRAAGAGGGRGGGIDLCFSAPKSVSVAWAIGDAWQREQIEAAHGRAVARSLSYLREQVPLVRRRYERQVVEEHAQDLLAAEYRHTTARGVQDTRVPDPQLHSHVVLTGVVRQDGRFVAVASRPLFRAGREAGAFYRCALADELAQLGYPIQAGTGRDGRYFELAGVPHALCQELSGRSREVAAAAERFRARYGRPPEHGELRNVKLENRKAKHPSTRGDLDRAWRQTAERFSFGPGEAAYLLAGEHQPPARTTPFAERVENSVTADRAVFEPRQLRASALEQAAGELSPEHALAAMGEMIAERRILPLAGERLTTLTVRAREQAIERHATSLAKPAGRDVGHTVRANAARQVAVRIGAQLTDEQELALRVLTGPERGAALIGPAGAGKGVVIDAVARAEQLAGRSTWGVAVAGTTAERLGADSPALEGQTLTIDALIARATRGSLTVDQHSTVILDEAGMADTARLHKLTDLIDRTGAKLIAVGDGRQLPSIGPGGMFDRITTSMPVVELQQVHRTLDPAEQRAWAALRHGNPTRALAHYDARGQLHFADTREQAAEQAVQAWAKLTETHDPSQVALIADASNQEIDRLNARAQHLRAQRGELGEQELPLQSVHYGLRQGDRVAFTGQHHEPGKPRVENGARGQVVELQPDGLTVALDGSDRHVNLTAEQAENLRLAYAAHIYRQQGATVEHSIILTGGWQAARESAYVEASRARQTTNWHLAREDLGTDGTDHDRIGRFAEQLQDSRAQTPSIEHEQAEALSLDHDPGRTPFPLAVTTPNATSDHDVELGLER
ncbi:MAG: MobF family relaxase [Solirubrobacteraceae bacterium]